ncbi:hypothetical protein TrispH2_011181 [Trichoplax sp. H2]|nr:hypothetical protein TrispH2_011181 [Trichoplax sp. H2]|eukprot:RDD37317.1 hypothetical protein TrispH2_011181 [Trichoplax sp. H2]
MQRNSVSNICQFVIILAFFTFVKSEDNVICSEYCQCAKIRIVCDDRRMTQVPHQNASVKGISSL